MSGASTSEDDDLLAGEYVLGLLDQAEAEVVVAEASVRSALAEAVGRWQDRLAPLLNLVPAVEPPLALWRRIESSLTSVDRVPKTENRSFWNSLAAWRVTAAATAAAASVAGLALLLQPMPMIRPVAVLTPTGKHGAIVVDESLGGAVTFYPVGPVSAPQGHDLELWSLPPGATRPAALGVLSAEGKVLPPEQVPPAGSQLLISIEPKGGSPTGLPTGTVVYATTLPNKNAL